MPNQGWYNIPELAKKYKVYAIDLLGFGWSEKALVEYDATVWKDQVSDFMKEVVKEPAILVGNSLGGFTALLTAAELPQQVLGVALLNSAGQFSNPNAQLKAKDEESAIKKLIINPLKEVFQRIVLGFLFWQAKQPARIESVLKSVWYSFTNERIPLRPNDVQNLLELKVSLTKLIYALISRVNFTRSAKCGNFAQTLLNFVNQRKTPELVTLKYGDSQQFGYHLLE